MYARITGAAQKAAKKFGRNGLLILVSSVHVRAVRRGRYAELDVSRIVTRDGMYSLRVSSRARDRVAYHSRDAAHNRPQLLVTLGD